MGRWSAEARGRRVDGIVEERPTLPQVLDGDGDEVAQVVDDPREEGPADTPTGGRLGVGAEGRQVRPSEGRALSRSLSASPGRERAPVRGRRAGLPGGEWGHWSDSGPG